jgi:hypothetical protein
VSRHKFKQNESPVLVLIGYSCTHQFSLGSAVRSIGYRALQRPVELAPFIRMWPPDVVLSDAPRSLTRNDLHLVKGELAPPEGSCLLVQDNT